MSGQVAFLLILILSDNTDVAANALTINKIKKDIY